MRALRYMVVVFAVLLPLSSCDYIFSCGCAYEMKKIRRRYGHPDHKSTFKSNKGYRAESWSYEPKYGRWRKYTFEWDEYHECDCEVIEETYYARKPAAKPQVRRWKSSDGEGDCALCP